jgi:hypothetical protein
MIAAMGKLLRFFRGPPSLLARLTPQLGYRDAAGALPWSRATR